MAGSFRPTEEFDYRTVTAENAITMLNVLQYQLQYGLLPIALWVISVILVIRFLSASLRAYEVYIHRQEDEESVKYRMSIAQVLVYVGIMFTVLVAGTRILTLMGVPLGAVVSVTALVSAAVGLGAKDIVGDFFRGIFIIIEKQYGYGDYVVLATDGGDKEGTVVGITLRATKLRTVRGEEVHIPNGSIVSVTNQTQQYSIAVCDIPVPPPPAADLATVNKVLLDVCASLAEDKEIRGLIQKEPEYYGVSSTKPTYNVFQIRIQTKAGNQWEVERHVTALCIDELAKKGISQADVTTVIAEG